MEELRRALQQIASLGGNLPDDRLTGRTGPNDAAHRGLMYCEARRIALEALGTRTWELAQDEHLPTVEGVLEYLERQNDLAFLEYRREANNKPWLSTDYAGKLMYLWEAKEMLWDGVGTAKFLVADIAKPKPVAVHTIAAMPEDEGKGLLRACLVEAEKREAL